MPLPLVLVVGILPRPAGAGILLGRGPDPLPLIVVVDDDDDADGTGVWNLGFDAVEGFSTNDTSVVMNVVSSPPGFPPSVLSPTLAPTCPRLLLPPTLTPVAPEASSSLALANPQLSFIGASGKSTQKAFTSSP